MTNKEKYPNAKVKYYESCGFYVVLNGKTYLVDGVPASNLEGWQSQKGRYYETQEQAQQALDSFMYEKPVVTLDKVKSELAKAKKLIGKHIKVLISGIGVTGNVTVVKGAEILLEKENNWSAIAQKTLDENGYIVVLVTEHGATLFDPNCYKLVKKVAVVNHQGQEYTAQDCGSFWKFGCAKISKQLIRDLYNVMSSKNYQGNRSVTKVTIGAADFSLDTLKDLMEYGE